MSMGLHGYWISRTGFENKTLSLFTGRIELLVYLVVSKFGCKTKFIAKRV